MPEKYTAPRLSVALLLATTLAACGGGGTPATGAGPAPGARPAPAAAPAVVEADTVLEWAEFKFPTLFAAGPQTLQRRGPQSFALAYQGTDYTVRAYPGDRYLGITADSRVYGLGDFSSGQLAGYGNVGDYVATMLADARTQTVGVAVTSPLAAGEQFRFGLGSATASAQRQGDTVALATLRSGDSYTVTQLDGPRACTLSANRSGMVGWRDIVVTADCGRPAGTSRVAGVLRAPVGAQVTLQLNGGPELALTVPAYAGSADLYNALPFSFDTALADGSAYTVAVRQAPSGHTCTVYKGGSGTTPVASGALLVGCELSVDLVSRSGSGASLVRGSFFNSRDLVIGGAAGAVGSTPVGYGEGRFVAFVSYIEGLGGASGRHRQVYWRDRLTNETRIVSVNAAGQEGNGESLAPAISADGLTVVFESQATNLDGADTNGARDVYVWSALNPSAGARRISVGEGGAQANSESFEPTVSGDGRWAAFTTSASNLVPGVDGTSTVNVVLRDLKSGTNTLVSRNAQGKGVGGSRPMLSEDGSRLAFYSFAADLAGGDGNQLWDVFVFDVGSGALRRVSLTTGGAERNQGDESRSRVVAPAISGNGRYVAWATTATNMAAGDTNTLQDLFVTDLQTGQVQWVSAGVGGAAGNGDSPVGQGERVSLSYNGEWIAFTTTATNLGVDRGQVVLRHWPSGLTRAVGVAGGTSGPPMISRDVAFVALGQSVAADPRFGGSGLFVAYTGLNRAWWWID
ncbi:MAG: hypothetical protein U1F50_21260 [Rubrivivax sp.]